MKEFKLLLDSKKINPKQAELLRELESITEVRGGTVFYDETNQEQMQKLKEVFDKYCISI